MLYYDVFDVREEEEYLESETERSRRELKGLACRLESNDPDLTEISLDLEMERESFARLVSVLSCSTHLRRLRCCHWGLGDSGALELAHIPNHYQYPSSTLSTSSLQQLALPSCGITNVGVEALLQRLIDKEAFPNLVRLDLSRNNLRRGGSLEGTFRQLLPRLSHVQELDLSATGLTPSLVHAILTGLEDNNSVRTLDISNNFDSLEVLLDSIMEHLPRMKNLERLVLARGASSSTCIDYTNFNVLEQLLLCVRPNDRLQFLGPLSILPLDRESDKATYALYGTCLEYLEQIRFCLERNQCHALVRGMISRQEPASLLPTAMAKMTPSAIYYLLRETASYRIVPGISNAT